MPTDDTNQRVAEACGMTVVVPCNCSDGVLCRYAADDDMFTFDPQHCETASVLAAEKFGLFDTAKYACELERHRDEWRVGYAAELRFIGRGTFCEAIVQAILHLHDESKPKQH